MTDDNQKYDPGCHTKSEKHTLLLLLLLSSLRFFIRTRARER